MEPPSKRSKSLEGNQMSLDIRSLPEVIIEDILSRVVNKSFNDLFNAKLVCKLFCRNAEKGFVFKAVELSKFRGPMLVPEECKAKFLQSCLANNNPQALYNSGVVDFFHCNEEAERIRNLKAAADGGYKRSSFVYAMIQLTLRDACEARRYFSRLSREEAQTVRRECSTESGIFWEHSLPEDFAEKMLEFDAAAEVTECYCNVLYKKISELDEDVQVSPDELLCDLCFMHQNHVWFLEDFVDRHLSCWMV